MKEAHIDINALTGFKIDATNNRPTSSIHFSGANGIPVGVYKSYLRQFADTYSIEAVDCRATLADQIPLSNFGFSDFADDLIKTIESKHRSSVIGMGHSFGAHITLIAAFKRPDLFSKLVLIEPASLTSPWLDLVYRHLPEKLVFKLIPMIARTAQRQKYWSDHQSFLERYSQHPTYKRFTSEAMRDYAAYGLRARENGDYELVFAREWEAHIFRRVEFIWKYLAKCNLPCLFLKAEHSSLYSNKVFHSNNEGLEENFTGLVLPNTYHLLPLEKPEICHQAISTWLNSKHYKS